MSRSPNKTFVRDGVAFEVPVGYASLEHYAKAMRVNLKVFVPRMTGEQREVYETEIAKLASVGL